MRKALTALVASTLILAGCSSLPSNPQTKAPSSIESQSNDAAGGDLVTLYQLHPEYLEKMLQSYVKGINVLVGRTFAFNFAVHGKDDELDITAEYKIIPIDERMGIPVLKWYWVYDVKKNSFNIYNMDETPLPSS